MSLRAYVIAGEPSGDQLGGHLMRGLRAETKVAFHGIGGPMMAEAGLASLFPMADLSVMGLAEVLPRLPGLLRRVRETTEDVLRVAPDVLITIDSPDFCLRVARKVRARNPAIKTVHYVAPSVWAWRPKRAAKMAKSIDHVLALLPFEPPYMEAAGMTCDFVGHPIVYQPEISEAEAAAFRAARAIPDAATLICLLPGSRRGEVTRQGATYRAAVEKIAAARPGTRVVIPAAAPVADLVAEIFAGASVPTQILDLRETEAQSQKWAAFKAADIAIAASGTVSLELARQQTPMVIGYQMSALSGFLMKRLVRLETATLVNIVSQTRAVPEFLFADFEAQNIADKTIHLLGEPAEMQHQKDAARLTMERLAGDGTDPGRQAARSVLQAVGVVPPR